MQRYAIFSQQSKSELSLMKSKFRKVIWLLGVGKSNRFFSPPKRNLYFYEVRQNIRQESGSLSSAHQVLLLLRMAIVGNVSVSKHSTDRRVFQPLWGVSPQTDCSSTRTVCFFCLGWFGDGNFFFCLSFQMARFVWIQNAALFMRPGKSSQSQRWNMSWLESFSMNVFCLPWLVRLLETFQLCICCPKWDMMNGQINRQKLHKSQLDGRIWEAEERNEKAARVDAETM